MLINIFGFILAASLGAFIRYRAITQFNFYWGTLLVNLVGSVAIGFLAVYLQRNYPHLRVFFLVAFLGSMTTFSSYSLDVVRLFDEGQLLKAAVYVVACNLLCLGGCFCGWKIAQVA